MEIHARNTNDLQRKVYRALLACGRIANSRNGGVTYIDEPVSICLTAPWERVNLCSVRDANPFFHLWESLAMIGDFNSVPFMRFFAKNMSSFSDNGATYNAFYGTRARTTWGDQVDEVIKLLARDPASRQAVVNLWDPRDLTKATKDKACNLMLLFSVDPARGDLLMTTYNRSNDAIWGGVNGANIVHLSFFQEYVACALNRPMGRWWHVSNNLHVYDDNPKWLDLRDVALEGDRRTFPAGADNEMVVGPKLFDHRDRAVFDAELHVLLRMAENAASTGAYLDGKGFTSVFLKCVAIPLFNAYQAHKLRDEAMAYDHLVVAPDWKLAAQRWLDRRRQSTCLRQPELPGIEG